MDSQTPEGGGRRPRPHKPFLIDPAEEGTKPQGVDGTWWAWMLSGWVQGILPRRFRGLPPLFYLPSLAGIVWGVVFIVTLAAGMSVEGFVEGGYGQYPRLPPRVLDTAVILCSALGLAQGIGVLLRKRWGLVAAYAWFGSSVVMAWFMASEPYGPADVVGAVLGLVQAACWMVYYHNRRAWFDALGRVLAMPDRQQGGEE